MEKPWNRYWDKLDTPRQEAYADDVVTAKKSARDSKQVFRHIRAAAESHGFQQPRVQG